MIILESNNVKVILEDQIADIMEQRGIKENDIQDVINYAMNGGFYMHSVNGEQILAKKRLGNFTLYVEYTLENDACKVLNIYSHRVSLTEDQI